MLTTAKKCVLATFLLTFSNATGAMDDITESLIDRFHTAIAEGDLEEIKRLVLEKQVDVNHQTFGNITALYQAAEYGDFDTVQWLVEKANAKMDLADHLGRMPLHMAAIGGHLSIVRWFITEGHADLDQPAHQGRTALYWSVARGYMQIARWLLQQGANPTALKSLAGQPNKNYNRVNYLLQEHSRYICNVKKATRELLISQNSQWNTLLPLLHEYLGWDTVEQEQASNEHDNEIREALEKSTARLKCFYTLSCEIL